MAPSGPVRAAVLLKHVDLHPVVDPLTGVAPPDPHGGLSAADRCALECALRSGDEVVALTAGPPAADDVLRDALAAGASRAVRVDLPREAPSAAVGAALAPLVAGCSWVWAGDHSLDRGSGSVPAFVAHAAEFAQALGLSAVDPEVSGAPLFVRRRLGGGRQELLRVEAPAVLSVEAGVVQPRRSSLAGVLAAARGVIEQLSGGTAEPTAGRIGPYRPRARELPPPAVGLTAQQRLLAISGALERRDPPRVVRADPAEAANLLLEFVRARGFLA